MDQEPNAAMDPVRSCDERPGTAGTHTNSRIVVSGGPTSKGSVRHFRRLPTKHLGHTNHRAAGSEGPAARTLVPRHLGEGYRNVPAAARALVNERSPPSVEMRKFTAVCWSLNKIVWALDHI